MPKMTIAVIIQPIAAVLLEGVLLICASLTACLLPRKRHSRQYTEAPTTRRGLEDELLGRAQWAG